jgi:hypothetical protein
MRQEARPCRDDSVAAAAREIHGLVCACAADDWCDSVYLVAAERAVAAFNVAELRRARLDLERALKRPIRWTH